jgi:hypothetical protein
MVCSEDIHSVVDDILALMVSSRSNAMKPEPMRGPGAAGPAVKLRRLTTDPQCSALPASAAFFVSLFRP